MSRLRVPSVEVFALDDQRRYVRMPAVTTGAVDAVPGLPDLTLDVAAMWADMDRLAPGDDVDVSG